MEQPSPLLVELRKMIRAYVDTHSIRSMTEFAELACVNRDTINDICKKNWYLPTWGTVTAIAVAVEMPPKEVKATLWPLYASYCSSRVTTSHRIVKSDITKLPTTPMRSIR